MEQARYWMWRRSTKDSSTEVPRLVVNGAAGCPYDHRPWEEKGFAEDTAAAHLGGCVWPPRSYSCSFCPREFRSAQALGGHMNIHRRDRARLKQSPPPDLAAEHVQRAPSRLVIRPQVISHLVFSAAANPKPNSGVLASPLSPRVPAKACTSLSPSFASMTARRIIIVPESKLGVADLGSKESDPGAYDEEITRSNKRRKLNGPTPVYSIRADEDDDEQRGQPQVLNCNLVQELDLELRLGNAPKIN